MLAAFGLAACGGGGGGGTASTGGTGTGTGTGTGSTGGTDAAPTAVAGVDHTTGLLAMIAAKGSDGAYTLPEIPAGMSETYGGVNFACADGEQACTVTLKVTQSETGVDMVSAERTGGEVTASFVDPLDNPDTDMNTANPASISAILRVAIDGMAVEANATASPPSAAAPAGADSDGTSVGGMKSGMLGVSELDNIGAADASKISVTGDFDPNSADVADTEPNEGNDTLNGGATDSALGRTGWNAHRVMHEDWGDTSMPNRDGGYETAAVVYSNIQPSSDVAFADVRNVIAHDNYRVWFTMAAGVVTIDTTQAAWAVPTANIVITVEDALVADITQVKTMDEQVQGTYFGASGLFTCTSATCRITRAAAGSTNFGIGDDDPVLDGSQEGGTWTFAPADGATVNLPDQNWLAFGFWLTAPDDAADGTHRVGVFHDGMQAYDYGNANNDDTGRLAGTATYQGSAAGLYVNRDNSGVFTADVNLDADFETNMLSGRVDNFKNSRGGFISSDTRTDPNDPQQGGEGDWFVELRRSAIGTMANQVDQPATNGVAAGNIGGSADGVQWSGGEWNAQLYGHGGRVPVPMMVSPTNPTEMVVAPAHMNPGVAPSGVAGTFRAVTDELSDGTHKGVVGAFGATLDEHTPPAAPAE